MGYVKQSKSDRDEQMQNKYSFVFDQETKRQDKNLSLKTESKPLDFSHHTKLEINCALYRD